jgi:hypothetical protein
VFAFSGLAPPLTIFFLLCISSLKRRYSRPVAFIFL